MFSFRLNDSFVATYTDRTVPWGFTDVAGNSFSELTFIDKYSRLKDDGTKETWTDVCERVTNGTYSIQKDHAKAQRLPWNDHKAQRSAQEFFDRLFHFKFTPPGRGLWVMGTPLVNVERNSAALQNCAFVSTIGMKRDNAFAPFAFLMEASMLGVGVGFDTRGVERGWKFNHLQRPEFYTGLFGLDPDTGRAFPPALLAGDKVTYVIPDTREGWVESTQLLVNTMLTLGTPESRDLPIFDYSQIRAQGAPIRTFGGTAAGPEPLRELHQKLMDLFEHRGGTELTSVDILDIGNLIGCCVVAGNVRRSAELAMGEDGDELFRSAKNYGTSVPRVTGIREEIYRVRDGLVVDQIDISAEDFDSGHYAVRGRDVIEHDWVAGPADYRKTWGWMSNNSISVKVGSDYEPYLDTIRQNGEPGFVWMDVTRGMGRGIDGPDDRDSKADGFNPCAEQPLEGGTNGQGECCTLVETYPTRCDDLEDYLRTLKFAYLYAKTVTLLPTHWAETNAIMQRNRRIGTSMSGIAEFSDTVGLAVLRDWSEQGYQTIRHYDRIYSEWLCVRESNRVTTVKPSGTVSLLVGVTPGAHWMPGGEYFLRAQRLAADSPALPWLRMAGYTCEPDLMDPRRTVVYFPIHHPGRAEGAVSVWEKAMLAVTMQRHWSDNAVSVTLSFNPDTEGDQLGQLLRAVEGQVKSLSFLPKGNQVYAQQPYQEITRAEYEAYQHKLMPVDFSVLYKEAVIDATGEAYCTTDACLVEIPQP